MRKSNFAFLAKMTLCHSVLVGHTSIGVEDPRDGRFAIDDSSIMR